MGRARACPAELSLGAAMTTPQTIEPLRAGSRCFAAALQPEPRTSGLAAGWPGGRFWPVAAGAYCRLCPGAGNCPACALAALTVPWRPSLFRGDPPAPGPPGCLASTQLGKVAGHVSLPSLRWLLHLGLYQLLAPNGVPASAAR